jgi:hypothetical protein
MEKLRVSSMNPQSVAFAAPGPCGARIIVYWLKSPTAISAESASSQGPVPGRPLASPQQPLQLPHVQPVAADHGPVEQQDGDVQTVAAKQISVAVDVHDLNRREGPLAAQRLQLGKHFVA